MLFPEARLTGASIASHSRRASRQPRSSAESGTPLEESENLAVAAATDSNQKNPAFIRERERSGKVPVSTKIAQGFGALPGSHKDFAFNNLLLLYYSQILGVPATHASLVLAAALLADALTDPLVGAYSDNFKSRLGRRHPFMYAAAMPLGAFVVLLFSPPAGASASVLLAWLLCFTLLVRLTFTFFVVPWNALAAEFSEDYVERTSIITYRFVVGWIGGALFSFAVYTYVFAGSDAFPDPANYPAFAIVLGSLIAFWALLTTHLTRGEIAYLPQPVQATPKFALRAMLGQVLLGLGNPNFRLLFTVTLLFAGIAGVGQVFDIYMNTYFWEFKPEDLRWFGFSIIGAAAAFVAVPFLQQRFQKHQILLFSLAAVMILAILKVTLRFVDVWPGNGDPKLLIALVAHVSVVMGFLTAAGIMFGSMIADLVDEQEDRVGRRQEGVYASAIAFSAKATSSLGLIIGGMLLDHIVALPRGTQPGELTGPTLFRLAFTDGIAVPLFYAVPILLITRYTLTRERLVEIQARLKRAPAPADERSG